MNFDEEGEESGVVQQEERKSSNSVFAPYVSQESNSLVHDRDSSTLHVNIGNDQRNGIVDAEREKEESTNSVSPSGATQPTTPHDAANRKEQTRPRQFFLRPSAGRFFSTLRGYLSCRKTMETAFLRDSDMQCIAVIEAKCDSGGIRFECGKADECKPEFQQQSVDGTPVKSLDDLYEAATTVLPMFRDIVNDLAKKSCASRDDDPHGTNAQSPRVIIATKGRNRAQAKATDDYATRKPGPAVSWLYDVVRASIEFQSSQEVSQCIKLLQEDDYYVVKAKNRFKKPALTGYRDFSVWIRIECQFGFQHICEIQIHHAGMKKLDSDLKSHALYEYFRSFFAGATEGLTDWLEDLEMISEGYELDDFSLDTFLKDSVDEDRLERLSSLFHEHLCEYDLALETYQRLLLIRKDMYGMLDHIAIAKTYDDQADVHRDMGQLDRAMELYEQCSKLYEGTSEISLAATYQHMAIITAEKGFPNDALSLYESSLEILLDMPDNVEMAVADIYNNMGNAKRDLGLLDDAIALHQKSLRIKKQYLGWEHSSVATSYNNMGLVRLKQRKVDAAISCFLEAMKVDQRTVGAEHTSMAVTQGNLGLAYEQKGELSAAREMYAQALDQRRSILGRDHEEVAWTCHNLARIYVKEKEFDRAIGLLEESLEIKRKCFGVDHSEIVATTKMLESASRKKNRGESDSEILENSPVAEGRERPAH
mmetsp:Transcript_31134/g.74848  ORF Transcript_31134/g.74848 Transcript_31134/m.74848 type:complete len:707 (-) Transcript_31134:848-2968(-)